MISGSQSTQVIFRSYRLHHAALLPIRSSQGTATTKIFQEFFSVRLPVVHMACHNLAPPKEVLTATVDLRAAYRVGRNG